MNNNKRAPSFKIHLGPAQQGGAAPHGSTKTKTGLCLIEGYFYLRFLLSVHAALNYTSQFFITEIPVGANMSERLVRPEQEMRKTCRG